VDLPSFIFAVLFPVEKQTCGPETRALHESGGPVISDFEFYIFWFSFLNPHPAFYIPRFGCPPGPGTRAKGAFRKRPGGMGVEGLAFFKPPALPEADDSGLLFRQAKIPGKNFKLIINYPLHF